ncbi:LTA synthase family protein [Collinsella sp. AGMB00827]|uniref:LTA synthase family protein n=1 Tax=Collinsella ureilytica TaxID=2869515 RepID=A0ABS7MM01_9ACTN|nr:LTA synthase family protein [Collinsella urealyticum]MBY4798307.1 LTA synthase family protein [Collinsella urealyticum]
MVEATPTIYGLWPLFSLFLLIGGMSFACVRTYQQHKTFDLALIISALPHAALLIALAVLIFNSQVENEPGWLVIGLVSLSISALGALTLLRPLVAKRIATLSQTGRIAVTALRDSSIILVVAILGVCLIEAPWNEEMATIGILPFLVAVIILLIAFAIAYFAGQRTGGLCALVLLGVAALGIIQHYVIEFKAAAILPSDLLAAGTAVAVGSGYEITITRTIVSILPLIALCLTLLSLIWPARPESLPKDLRSRAIRVSINLAAAALVILIGQGLYHSVQLDRDLQIGYSRWDPLSSYRASGFIPVFTSILQDFAIKVPEGYTASEADELTERLAATWHEGPGATPERLAASQYFHEQTPSIIAIMNETFSDLSRFPALAEAGYTGPVLFNSIPDAKERGSLLVSVVGGGTANTEFEFLTGASMAFVGSSKVPYQLYRFNHLQTLPRVLGEAGWSTCAIHPQFGFNYNRAKVYPEMGFDTFLDDHAFVDAPTYHNWTSDRATYDAILDRLRNNPEPQFVFDVTMQNHGGYAADTVPEKDKPGIVPVGIDDEGIISELNVYLACMQRSDEDLAYLIEELRGLDRPVALVFFGDHQPSFSKPLNDALYPDEDEESADHLLRIYETPYLIWTNYELQGEGSSEPESMPAEGDNDGAKGTAGFTYTADEHAAAGEEEAAEAPSEERPVIGASALAARLLEIIGAPLSPYQQAQLALRQELPAVSAFGIQGADGLKYRLDDARPWTAALDSFQHIHYRAIGQSLR